jgi:hypothetical protein
MTKAELIQALQESCANSDEEIIVWVGGCRRTISEVDSDIDGLTLTFSVPKT